MANRAAERDSTKTHPSACVYLVELVGDAMRGDRQDVQ
jgi:hypothetical protein